MSEEQIRAKDFCVWSKFGVKTFITILSDFLSFSKKGLQFFSNFSNFLRIFHPFVVNIGKSANRINTKWIELNWIEIENHTITGKLTKNDSIIWTNKQLNKINSKNLVFPANLGKCKFSFPFSIFTQLNYKISIIVIVNIVGKNRDIFLGV